MKRDIKKGNIEQFIKDMELCYREFVILLISLIIVFLCSFPFTIWLRRILDGKGVISYTPLDFLFFGSLIIFVIAIVIIIIILSKKELVSTDYYVIDLKKLDYKNFRKLMDGNLFYKRFLNTKSYSVYSHNENEKENFKIIFISDYTNGREFSFEQLNVEKQEIEKPLWRKIEYPIVFDKPCNFKSLTYVDFIFVNEINAEALKYIKTKIILRDHGNEWPYFSIKFIVCKNKIYMPRIFDKDNKLDDVVKGYRIDAMAAAKEYKNVVLNLIDEIKKGL